MLADPLPTERAPTPPARFRPGSESIARGHYPRNSELATMPGVISDLRRFDDFAARVGSSIGNRRAATISLVERALEWRKEREAAEAWLAYARSQDNIAWSQAMGELKEIRAPFGFCVAKEADLGRRYGWLTQLFEVARLATEKATKTKTKKATAKAAADLEAAEKAGAAAKSTVAPVEAPPTKTIVVNT